VSERDEQADAAVMTAGEHIEELRGCMIRAMAGAAVGIILCFVFHGYLLEVLVAPYIAVCRDRGLPATLVTLRPQEAFLTVTQVSVVGGLIVSSPWWIWQLWRFVAAGLLPRERRWAKLLGGFGGLCFLGGVVFLYLAVLPLCLGFFLDFGGQMAPAAGPTPASAPASVPAAGWMVQPMTSLAEYVDLVTGMALAFGIAFLLPVAVVLLASVQMVTVKGLSKARRYVVFVAAIVGAVLTPPDVLSQIALAAPLVGLYELGVLVARIIERRRRREEARNSS
jgi:sec-independent protein translocase protein TatC